MKRMPLVIFRRIKRSKDPSVFIRVHLWLNGRFLTFLEND